MWWANTKKAQETAFRPNRSEPEEAKHERSHITNFTQAQSSNQMRMSVSAQSSRGRATHADSRSRESPPASDPFRPQTSAASGTSGLSARGPRGPPQEWEPYLPIPIRPSTEGGARASKEAPSRALSKEAPSRALSKEMPRSASKTRPTDPETGEAVVNENQPPRLTQVENQLAAKPPSAGVERGSARPSFARMSMVAGALMSEYLNAHESTVVEEGGGAPSPGGDEAQTRGSLSRRSSKSGPRKSLSGGGRRKSSVRPAGSPATDGFGDRLPVTGIVPVQEETASQRSSVASSTWAPRTPAAPRRADGGRLFLNTKPRDYDRFRAECRRLYHTDIQCWRKLLDPEMDGRVSLPRFCRVTKPIGFTHATGFVDVRAIFNYLDTNGGGYLTLENWDEVSFGCLMEFRQHCLNEFVDLEMAFSHGLDINGSATCDAQEIKQFCFDMEFTRDPKILFKALDYHRRGFIVNDDIMFLSNWCTAQHGLERFNVSRARKTLNERRQHRLKLASREEASRLASRQSSRDGGGTLGTTLGTTSGNWSMASGNSHGKSTMSMGGAWDLAEATWSYGASVSTEPIVRPERVFAKTKRDIKRITNKKRNESEVEDYLVLRRQAMSASSSPERRRDAISPVRFTRADVFGADSRPQTVA